MTITRQQVEKLDQLYRERQSISKAKEYVADRNMWIGIANDAFSGTGTRSEVLNRLGGSGEFTAFMSRVVCERFETMMQAIDVEIEQNGGQP